MLVLVAFFFSLSVCTGASHTRQTVILFKDRNVSVLLCPSGPLHRAGMDQRSRCGCLCAGSASRVGSGVKAGEVPGK